MKKFKIKSKEGEGGGYNFVTDLMTILLSFSFLTVLVPTIFFISPLPRAILRKKGNISRGRI